MKLSELNALNGSFSATASTQARTFSFAGLALVWLFAGPFFQREEGAVEPAGTLFVAGVCFAASLGLDLAQLYIRAGLTNAAFHREQLRLQAQVKAQEDPQTGNLGRALSLSTAILFYMKAVPLLVGYVLILVFFARSV